MYQAKLLVREYETFRDQIYQYACLNCAYYKHTAGKKQDKLSVIEKIPASFHTVHIDHVGPPFETSRKQNKFIFVLVDAFTKFTIVEPVKSQKTC